jgi:hypothetical protein
VFSTCRGKLPEKFVILALEIDIFEAVSCIMIKEDEVSD